MAAEPFPADKIREVDSPHAWLMVALAFATCFVGFGVVYSFGAFFRPMAQEFGADRAHTSIIFSFTATVFSILGLVGGKICDRFGPRPALLLSALTLGAGLITTASVHSLATAYLTYGIGVGIGVGCSYVPMLAVVGGWFERRRNAAMGVAVSGIGVGTLAVAPLAAVLINHVGWRGCDRLMGVAGALILLVCAMFAEKPPRHRNFTPRPVSHVVRSRDFILLYISSLFISVTIYTPLVYLPGFAQSRGIHDVAAASLVGLVGASSVIGRLGIGPIADRVGVLPLYRVSLLIMGLSYAIWPFATAYSIMVLFTLVMGSSYGAMVSLSPTLTAELFGIEGLGTLIGALYTGTAVSALLGPPLVGFAIDHGSYLWAAVIAGGSGILSLWVLYPVRARNAEGSAAASKKSA